MEDGLLTEKGETSWQKNVRNDFNEFHFSKKHLANRFWHSTAKRPSLFSLSIHPLFYCVRLYLSTLSILSSAERFPYNLATRNHGTRPPIRQVPGEASHIREYARVCRILLVFKKTSPLFLSAQSFVN